MSLKKRKTELEALGNPITIAYKKKKRKEAIKILEEVKTQQNSAPIMLRKGEGEFSRKLKEKREKQEKQG